MPSFQPLSPASCDLADSAYGRQAQATNGCGCVNVSHRRMLMGDTHRALPQHCRVGGVARRLAPYEGLAPAYDRTLGLRFFTRVRGVFEKLQRVHGFTFETAADVGCGTGLFACYLARRWNARVYAVDRSRSMLREASTRCRGERVVCLLQDIRRLSLPRPVDLIAANYDVINHVTNPTDVRCLLRRVHDNLRPGGHFFFDAITPCLSMKADTPTRWTFTGRCQRMEQTIRWEPCTRTLRITIVRRQPGSVLVEHHAEQTYRIEELAAWLREAGLVLRGVYDAETAEFATKCKPRVLFLAERTHR